ncbi:hypothetical protein HKX48_003696 [Thoreauomyces humboldtii]|nr:hypothetical protein HKX48_003696 [Thoreauomyces humboldtii]
MSHFREARNYRLRTRPASTHPRPFTIEIPASPAFRLIFPAAHRDWPTPTVYDVYYDVVEDAPRRFTLLVPRILSSVRAADSSERAGGKLLAEVLVLGLEPGPSRRVLD